jgi:hypothetical protein
MKSKSFKGVMGSVFVIGMLAASPAHAGSGLIKVTHSATPYRGGYQTAPSTVAKVQPVESQTKTAEVQVAVLAKSPMQPGARRSVFVHR